MIVYERNNSHWKDRMKSWIWLIPYLLAVLSLWLIAPYDLMINQFLYQRDHPLAILFERFVLLPVELLIPLSFYAFYQIRKKRGFFLCYMIASLIIALEAAKYWVTHRYGNWMVAGFTLLLALLVHVCLKTIPVDRWKQQERFFLYVLAVFFSAMAITFLLKQCWGRVRFREMEGDLSLFTPWFQINGSNGHHSFPSAHTCAMSVILCFWHYRFNGRTPIPLLGKGILLLGVLLMMGMRMVAGAHFFSDVVVGFTITYSMILLWHSVLRKGGFYGSKNDRL